MGRPKNGEKLVNQGLSWQKNDYRTRKLGARRDAERGCAAEGRGRRLVVAEMARGLLEAIEIISSRRKGERTRRLTSQLRDRACSFYLSTAFSAETAAKDKVHCASSRRLLCLWF